MSHLCSYLRSHFKDRLQPPEWPELAPVLARLAAELTGYGNFNMLLSDGQLVWQALDPGTRAFPVALPISAMREPTPA